MYLTTLYTKIMHMNHISGLHHRNDLYILVLKYGLQHVVSKCRPHNLSIYEYIKKKYLSLSTYFFIKLFMDSNCICIVG